jgi:hypothetical protein
LRRCGGQTSRHNTSSNTTVVGVSLVTSLGRTFTFGQQQQQQQSADGGGGGQWRVDEYGASASDRAIVGLRVTERAGEGW